MSVVGAIGAVVAGCTADADPDAAIAFTRTDSAGVELAVTTYAEPVPTPGWRVGEAPVVVYGESDGDDVRFVWIRDAIMLPDGRVVAIDGRTQDLYFFGPEGDLTAKAGGSGDGPGEFRDAGGIALLGGDTILVHGSRHRRFSLFDMGGVLLGDRPMQTPGGGAAQRSLTLYGMADAADDTLTLVAQGFTVRMSAQEDYVSEFPTLRYGADGSFLGEVGEPVKSWFYATAAEPASRLFGGQQGVAAEAGRVYVNDRERYEIRVHEPPRGLVRVHRLLRPRVPVTDELVDRYKRLRTEGVEDPERRRQSMERLDRSPVADSMAWIRRFDVDALGNVWVHEWAPPGAGAPAVGVFAADGPWLGAIELPSRFQPLEIGEDYMLGVLADELDVQHLVRFALERRPDATAPPAS